jgi:hypothetical protein
MIVGSVPPVPVSVGSDMCSCTNHAVGRVAALVLNKKFNARFSEKLLSDMEAP